MKTRIAELAKQADQRADTIWIPDTMDNWFVIRDQEFAKLIVQECTGILDVEEEYTALAWIVEKFKVTK